MYCSDLWVVPFATLNLNLNTHSLTHTVTHSHSHSLTLKFGVRVLVRNEPKRALVVGDFCLDDPPDETGHRELYNLARGDGGQFQSVCGDHLLYGHEIDYLYRRGLMSGQVRSGQVRSGQVRSGQVRSGQVRSGQLRIWAGKEGAMLTALGNRLVTTD